MPLDEDFGPQIYSSNADLCNVRFPTPIYPLTLSLRFLCRATVLTASRYNRRLGASPAGAAPLRSSSSHSSTGSSRRKARRRRRFGGRTLILRERWKCVEAHAFSLHSILANGWAPIVFFLLQATRATPYLETGMTGRPVRCVRSCGENSTITVLTVCLFFAYRALVEFVRRQGLE